MSVITRIDARAQRNCSFQLQDSEGNILAVVEVVPNTNEEVDVAKFRNEANLRIHTHDNVRIVKGNGAVLRKK